MASCDSVHVARRRLRDVLRRAQRSGLDPDDVTSLPAAAGLVSLASRGICPMGGGTMLAVAMAVLFLAAALALCCSLWGEPQPRGDIVGDTPWGHQRYQTLCTVAMPERLVRVFRPPLDCATCAGVRHVERVQGLSPSLFRDRYTDSGRPVVVTDATRNWTAPQVFTLHFLRRLYRRTLGHVQGVEPWRVTWRNCDDRASAILRQHYGRPYFLPPGADSEWIQLCSPGYTEAVQVEAAQQPSWQAQVRGSKRWSLHPPPECYYECASLEVTVHPGEIIVVDPSRWYLETAVVSEELSITVGAELDLT